MADTKPFTKKEIKEYIACNGVKCPRCDSTDIEMQDRQETESDGIFDAVRCIACGLTWTDHYQIVSIEISDEVYD